MIAYNDFNEGQGEDARSIIICDGKSGKLIKKLRTDGTLGLSFFPDGSRLISHYRDIDFWNTTNWKIQKTLKKNTDGMVAISPDMKRLAYSTSPRNETILVLFSLEKNRPSAELRGGAWPDGLLQFNGQCSFSPNGKWLFAIMGVKVRMWDAFSGKLKTDIETRCRSSLSSFAVSPDNKHLVVGGGLNCLEVWSLDPIKKLHDLKGHGPKMWIKSVAFSPKGDMLLTGTSDVWQRNEVKLWDTKNWREIGSMEHLGDAGCVNFLPNGKEFVTGRLKNDGSVEIFRVADVIKKTPGKSKDSEDGDYAHAEIKGQLIKMGLKEKTWNVVVRYKPGPGAFYCPLVFIDKAMEEAAKRLKDKVVIVTGTIVPNSAFGGFGGESFLFVPGPSILVKTLRPARMKRDPEEAFRKTCALLAALEGEHDLLKGVSKVKPDIKRDQQKRLKSARLVFEKNAVAPDKNPAKAQDSSKPFFFVSVEVWAGRSQQPPPDLHEFEWKGQTYQMWVRIYGSDAGIVRMVRKSVNEPLRGPLAPKK